MSDRKPLLIGGGVLALVFLGLFLIPAGEPRPTPEPLAGAGTERYVIYLQSDFTLDNDSCGQRKFDQVWSIMPRLVEGLVERHAVLTETSGAVQVRVMGLNKGQRTLGSFDELGQSWGSPEILRSPQARQDEADDIVYRLREAHRAALRDPEEISLQDVAESVRQLLNDRGTYLGTGTRRLRVIYLSDMLHYTTKAGQTDAASGAFDFVDSFSRDAFRSLVDHDSLPPATPLRRLGSTPFEVYSIRIRRCPNEPWSGGVTPAWEEVYGPSDDVWTEVFEKLGAEPVRLGLVEASGIVPEGSAR